MAINLFDLLERYERGTIRHGEELQLFSVLIHTGLAWTWSHDTYERAEDLIERGYLSPSGDLLPMAKDTLMV